MGALYQTNFMRFVSTAAYYSKHKIISLTTAIELANGHNNLQDVDSAPHTGGGHDNDDKQNDAEGVVHGPTVLAHVHMAKRVGMLPAVYCCSACVLILLTR
jgi:hypothetical protein